MKLFRPVAPFEAPEIKAPLSVAEVCFTGSGILMIVVGVYLLLGLGFTLLMLGAASCAIGYDIHKLKKQCNTPAKSIALPGSRTARRTGSPE